MQNNYIYMIFDIYTGEIISINKGRNNSYKNISKKNTYVKERYKSNNLNSEILYNSLTSEEAFIKKELLVNFYKKLGHCKGNLQCHRVNDKSPKERMGITKYREWNNKRKKFGKNNSNAHPITLTIGDNQLDFGSVIDCAGYLIDNEIILDIELESLRSKISRHLSSNKQLDGCKFKYKKGEYNE